MDVESMVELVVEQTLWDGLVGGVHGEKHWLRVFKLADKIINCMTLNIKTRLVVNRGVVGLAALLHDVGRIHDGRDYDHGYRGAAIAFKVAGNVFASGKNQLDLATPTGFHKKMVELGKIADIVSRHCLPGPGDYLEMQIVKDADKLDRVRFGGKKAVDVNRLALVESKSLLDDAVGLYDESKAVAGGVR